MNYITGFFTKGGDNNQLQTQNQNTQSKPFIIRPKGKEIIQNTNEEKNIKYIKTSEYFTLTIEVHGKSLFQNLVLTARASTGDVIIPIDIVWKRTNVESTITITDIKSSSYMPTAEDIGYIIEIEVTSQEYPGEIAIAQYGPITMDKDMQSAIELLLTSGNTHFSCSLYDEKEQERIPNKELILYLGNDALKLVEVDYNRKETILEQCTYSKANPIIKMHSKDMTRFDLTFMEYYCEDEQLNPNELSSYFKTIHEGIVSKKKSEYKLMAMSKQCRELLYLIIQFFIIDERVKETKIFSLTNYNNLAPEARIGVTELITEVKSLQEANSIYHKNMKKLELVNRRLREDMKNLEEDFQITLSQINNSNLGIAADVNKNWEQHASSHSSFNSKQKGNLNRNISSTYNKEYDELHAKYNALKAKEKAMLEEKEELLLNAEKNKTIQTQNDKEIKELKLQLEKANQDLKIQTKNAEILRQQTSEYQSQIEQLSQAKTKLQSEMNNKITNIETQNELAKIKTELEQTKKQNEKVQYENKNLIVQRNLLSNQKADLTKEFEKFKTDNTKLTAQISSMKSQIEGLQQTKEENEKILDSINTNHEQLKKEYNDLKNSYDLLKIDNKVLQDNYDKALENSNAVNISLNQTSIKISPDEFNEYDQLRKERDELEARIMQLESNNEAKDLEIDNLKMIIDSYKK
jgi:chromosome segregation ATPase